MNPDKNYLFFLEYVPLFLKDNSRTRFPNSVKCNLVDELSDVNLQKLVKQKSSNIELILEINPEIFSVVCQVFGNS